MKKILLAVAGSMVLGAMAPAPGADLPARTYTKAPAVVSTVYNWSGFYIGLNGGGGSAHTCWNLSAQNPVADPAAVGPEGCHNATGGTVGGQIGYRWQATNWVFGVEAQGNWASFKGSNTNLIQFFSTVDDHTKIDAFGLFTGQVGYAWNNVLFYAKGGAAVVDDKYSWVFNGSISTLTGAVAATGSETRWGGTAGGGVEFGFAPGWSVGVEYDHLFLGTADTLHTVLPRFTPPNTVTHRISQDVDMGTVRVNYTFGGPLVPRF